MPIGAIGNALGALPRPADALPARQETARDTAQAGEWMAERAAALRASLDFGATMSWDDCVERYHSTEWGDFGAFVEAWFEWG
ncbi:MAG: hypothetical protein MO853_03015 [Candidatus Protistobacter heckmanni]|nr:hypothetical protein [Candidatus Protistobacter heckmanni]